jgi:hypothetical protein
MNKNKLEEYIKNNRDAFDFREPSAEIWENIKPKAAKGRTITFRIVVSRVAAVAVLAIISSVLLWQSGVFTKNNYAATVSDPELRELIEAEAFYSHKVDKRLQEIQKCYYTFPELKAEIEGDLTELEQMYKVLKNDLRENISNKRVIEAMIENNRYRLKLCDDVLTQINC